MATRDFRSQQIRTTQIIASGTNAGTGPERGASLLIYSASAATNDQGSVLVPMTASVGFDNWMFISGSTRVQDNQQVLFGGNVVVSGSLTSSHIGGHIDSSLKLSSDHDMNFHIDYDTGQTSKFFFYTGPSTAIATLDELGNLQIDSDIQVDGLNIRQ